MLLAGSVEAMTKFTDGMHYCFDLSKSIIEEPLIYNGCRISHTERGDIMISIYEYMTSIPYVYVSRSRRKSQKGKANNTEITAYRKVLGSLM